MAVNGIKAADYAAVPATLKAQVKELLEESGLGDLAVEAAG